MPLAIQIIDHYYYMFFVGILLSVAAVETSVIQIRSKEAKDFVTSVFHATTKS